MPGLLDLPVELLFQIHLDSLSPALPIVNRHLHAILSRPSARRAAVWLWILYAEPPMVEGPRRLLIRDALRHGVCGIEVVRALEEMWNGKAQAWQRMALEREHELQRRRDVHTTEREDEHKGVNHPDESTPPPEPSTLPAISPTNPYQPLRLPELPRRIFRAIGPATLPFLHHLYTYAPPPSANSHRGYPLARAVLAGDVALIRFLLDRGADPALKEGLAMQIAVKRGDVALCRMLYERPAGRGSDAAGDSSMHSFTPIADVSIAIPSGKRKRTSSPPEQSPRKRARTALDRNTRMCMTPDLMRCVMACGHRGVMDYFLGEMGCVPSLGSIMALR